MTQKQSAERLLSIATSFEPRSYCMLPLASSPASITAEKRTQ